MQRKLETHKTNPCNEKIDIVVGRVGAGGGPVRYDVFGPRLGMNPTFSLNMRFQDGPVDQGVNGLTNEAVVAILIDRLEGFQTGEFACTENTTAIGHLKSAMKCFRDRSVRREQEAKAQAEEKATAAQVPAAPAKPTRKGSRKTKVS